MSRIPCLLVFLFLSNLFPLQATPTPLPELRIPFSQQLSPNTVIVPFQLLVGLIVIKAEVNGQLGNFIVDTGASGLVLNERYFEPDRYLESQQGMGLGGSTSDLGEHRVDSMYLEELVFHRVQAQTINLEQLERSKNTKLLGLIGYHILRDFEILFDYGNRILTFSKTDKKGNVLTPLPHTSNKADSMAFRLGNFIPILEVTVNGIEKKMGLDTGAEYNLLHSKRWKDIREHFTILRTINIANTSEETIEALAGRLSRLAFKKKYRCRSMLTVLTNLRDLELIYGTRLDGILGYEFMATWQFSLNYKRQLLFLHPMNNLRP